MIWWIIGTLISIMMLVFLVVTLRILFVFIGRFRKNIVLNKSVAKSVFSGKVSLIVILLFFGISFAFVGGMQLLTKSGERSILQQYNENNVFKYEWIDDDIMDDGDDVLNAYQAEYNEGLNPFKNNTDYISQSYIQIENAWLIDSLGFEENWLDSYYGDGIEWYDGEERGKFVSATDTAFFAYMDDKHSDILVDGMTFNDFIPLTQDEYQLAVIDHIYDIIVTEHSEYLEGAAKVYKIFFGNSISDLNDFILQLSVFNYKIGDKKISSFLDYSLQGYYNLTPKGSESNTDFEIITYNDVLEKYNADEQYVNNIIFSNGSYNEFLQQESTANSYQVIVQQDYLDANGLSVGDEIEFTTGIKFHVYDSVRFSEVTYPTMGVNFLPDESKQAFVGMKMSDFYLLSNTLSDEQYSSLYNRAPSFFFDLKAKDDSTKYNTNDWTGINDTFEQKKIELLGSFVQELNTELSPYRINNEQFNSMISYLDDPKWIIENSNQAWNITSDSGEEYYLGSNFQFTNFWEINEYSSAESIRALMGSVEMVGTKSMISVLVIVFMVIILIVLSMLISKRINDSGKQLGTLKAMGMKNKQIASSYILFPLIIVFLGFVVAALLSPIVMVLFQNLMGKYYYISFTAFPLSFSFFWTLLFVPLILSIGLCYFISIRVLRKPTLDLLSNKGKDAPNIFVRAAGYVTPTWTPFTVSYAGKGILRAMGKSVLLFISIFLSVFLTSFAMSTTTMIKTQTDHAMSYLNFESFSAGQNNNYGQFDTDAMYRVDENGVVDTDPAYIKDSTPIEELYSKVELGQLIEYYISGDFVSAYNLIDGNLNKTLGADSACLTYVDGSVENEFYITSSYMAELAASLFMLEEMFNRTEIEGTLSQYEATLDETLDEKENLIRMSEVEPMIYRWIVQSAQYLNSSIKSSETVDPDKPFDNLPDVVFGNYYYNQYEETVVAAPSFLSERMAINDSDRKLWETKYDSYYADEEANSTQPYSLEEVDGKEWIMGSVLKGKDGFINCWGTVENGKGEKLWNDAFAADYNKVVSGGNLGYIPVIASTQSQMLLDQWADTEYATGKTLATRVEGTEDEYIVSIEANTYTKTTKGGTYSLSKTPIKVKIKVRSTMFVGVDMGINTIDTFVENYFENYEVNAMTFNPNNTLEDEEWVTDEGFKFANDKWSSDKDIISVGDSASEYENAFHFNPMATYNYDEYKGEQPEGTDKASPLSISLTRSAYNSSWNDSTAKTAELYNATIPTSKIFDSEDGFYYSKAFKADNGTQVSIETLLSQGAKAYEMIMGMFMLMSVFIIFMATTIIVISMKDVIDSSKREVSMLKAFGYSNTRSTMLIMIPYIVVAAFAFVIAVPLTFGGLASVAALLTTATGNTFIFTLTTLQWFLVCGYVFGLIGILTALGFISFYRTNALEAIKATDE